MKSGIKVVGLVTLKVINEKGLVHKTVKKNLVGNYGTSLMAAYLANVGDPLPIQYIAVGDGDLAPAVTDTALGNELYRAIASVSQGIGAEANQVEFQSTWLAGASQGTIKEAGLFDAAAVGNMFSRVTFADVIVGAADTLIVTWDISFIGV